MRLALVADSVKFQKLRLGFSEEAKG